MGLRGDWPAEGLLAGCSARQHDGLCGRGHTKRAKGRRAGCMVLKLAARCPGSWAAGLAAQWLWHPGSLVSRFGSPGRLSVYVCVCVCVGVCVCV